MESREAADALVHALLQTARDCLPALDIEQYYWHQLIGLSVQDVSGADLGRVVSLMETGANDVLVIQDSAGSESLVPYIDPVVLSVDVNAGVLVVDWDLTENED